MSLPIRPCDCFVCTVQRGCPEDECVKDDCPFWACAFCERKEDCLEKGNPGITGEEK